MKNNKNTGEWSGRVIMNLLEAKEGQEYTVKSIRTEDEELDAFLFSLDVTAASRSQ